MARWRTLHEIPVVATLIADNDNELAHRYLAHDVVESKRALDVCMRTHASLGYRAPANREVKRTERLYRLVLRQFGDEMANDNGWAAILLKKKGHLLPTWKRLPENLESGRITKWRARASMPVSKE